MQVHGIYKPFKAHNARHQSSAASGGRAGVAWDLFDKVYATSKRAWALPQVDIVLSDARRFLKAARDSQAITPGHCADLIAFIQELEEDKTKLFGATVNGKSSVFNIASSMTLDWNTQSHEGMHRELAGHAGLPGATAKTTLSSAADLSQLAGERRSEQSHMLKERESSGISTDETLPKAVREAYISICCRQMAASLAKGAHYCYFQCPTGGSLPAPTEKEPWRVIAVWNPAATPKGREVAFGPRLYFGHLMEIFEQDGELRISCLTKECQQFRQVCPHVAGWHQCIGVGDADDRYLRLTFDGSRDEVIFTSKVRPAPHLPPMPCPIGPNILPCSAAQLEWPP